MLVHADKGTYLCVLAWTYAPSIVCFCTHGWELVQLLAMSCLAKHLSQSQFSVPMHALVQLMARLCGQEPRGQTSLPMTAFSPHAMPLCAINGALV